MVDQILCDLQETRSLLEKLNIRQFNFKVGLLSGSSIGMHFRHIIEFYLAVFTCQESICYEKRARKKELEQNLDFGIKTIDNLITELKKPTTDKFIVLITNSSSANNIVKINTNLYRELYYCYEHSIYHKALIKIGLKTLGIEDAVNSNFGVAPATLEFSRRQKPNPVIVAV
jgi:hypothetical protein